MSRFRFSPITDYQALLEAIAYIHTQTHLRCRAVMGRFLPVAGNIGVFCHEDHEFGTLTALRETLTYPDIHWNRKYYLLRTPITVPAGNAVPEAIYTYLYIRKPDPLQTGVGDADFYLPQDAYTALKKSVIAGKAEGLSVFERPDLDLLRIDNAGSDVSAFIGSYDLRTITSPHG